MRQLVLAYGYEAGLAEQDVGGLVDGIGEHQPADGGLPGVRDLVLDRGIAAEFGDADQAEEGQQQLVERGHGAVGEDRGAVRVGAGGEVVDHQALAVLGEPVGDVAVGDDLVVGDDHEQLRALALEADPVLQGAEVVAEMERAGRAVAGEDTAAGEVGARVGVRVGERGVVQAGGHCGVSSGWLCRPEGELCNRGKCRRAVRPDGPGSCLGWPS